MRGLEGLTFDCNIVLSFGTVSKLRIFEYRRQNVSALGEIYSGAIWKVMRPQVIDEQA
jgi:hypothetical protein